MKTPDDITADEYDSLVIPELEAARATARYRPWTKEELRILGRYYPDMDIPMGAICEVLRRSLDSIRCKARAIGLSRR